MKLKSLQRITSSNNYIPLIDGMRFVAIATVVLMHLHTHLLGLLDIPGVQQDKMWLQLLLRDSQNGVLVFFVLSRFILGIPFAKQEFMDGAKVKLGRFYLRRLTRLEPPYFIVMTLFFLVHLFFLRADFSELILHYLAGLSYTHFLIYNEWNPILPVTWSLETEIQFYIVMPLLALFYKIRNFNLRFAFMMILVICSIYVGIHAKEVLVANNLGKSVFYYASFFIIGLLFADIYVRNTYLFDSKWVFWDIIFASSMMLLFVFGRDIFFPRYMRTFIMVPLFLSAFKGKYVSRFLESNFVSITGGMCYTIYLLHFPIIHLLFLFWKPNYDSYGISFLVSCIVGLPIIWLICALFFRFIEKPFMRGEWYKNFRL